VKYKFLAVLFLLWGMPALSETPPLKIVVLGDSLVSGYNIQPQEAFPARLEAQLKEKKHSVQVINAGIAGDTSAGGLARIQGIIDMKPQLVLVELGGNDMLRGMNPASMEKNLDQIITRLKAANINVLLVGMKAAINMGLEYKSEFDAVYPRLAKKHDIALYPFFAEGIALKPQYNLPDGIHPNPAGVDVIVGNIIASVEEVLKDIK
jgi:acyl-CoA thioesterase-1